MAYDERLANRIREALSGTRKVEEKIMFKGITFMVNGKMCVSVSNEEMLCRIDPEHMEGLLEENGVRPMVHGGKVMKGFVYVDPEILKTKKQFDFWIGLALEFNKKAKAAPKKKNVK